MKKKLTKEKTFKQALSAYKTPVPATITAQAGINAWALEKAIIFIESLFAYNDGYGRVLLTDPVLTGTIGDRIFIDFILETSASTLPGWGNKRANHTTDLPDPVLSKKLENFYLALDAYMHETNLNDPHQTTITQWLENPQLSVAPIMGIN